MPSLLPEDDSTSTSYVAIVGDNVSLVGGQYVSRSYFVNGVTARLAMYYEHGSVFDFSNSCRYCSAILVIVVHTFQSWFPPSS